MRKLAAVLLLLLAFPNLKAAEKPLVIMQGKLITIREFISWYKEVTSGLPPSKSSQDELETMKSLLKTFVERKMLLEEAKIEGIRVTLPQDTPESVRDDFIIDRLLEKKLSNIKVEECEIKKMYKTLYGSEKKKLVLFKSLKFYDLGEARKLLYKLKRMPRKRRRKAFIEYKKKKGEDFLDELNSRYFSQDELPDEFIPVFRARKGDIVGPVVTESGIFLFFIEDVKLKKPPPFKKVRKSIEKKLIIEKEEKELSTYMESLYKKYRPEINWELLCQYSTEIRKSPEGGAR